MGLTRLKRLFWVVGATLALAGLIGWYDRLVVGHQHARYGQLVTWGLWVSAYIYFIGLSAGAFLISALVYVFNVKRFEPVGRLAVWTAVVTLLMALLCIWADIGHMDRFWHVLVYPNFKSPMAWMIWLYFSYVILLLTELWFLLRRDWVIAAGNASWKGALFRVLTLGSRNATEGSAERDRRIVRVLASVGVPLAVMFHGGVGALFGVVSARPHWHSGMYPIHFLSAAMVSGGALLTLVSAVFQEGWRTNRETVLALGRLVFGLLLIDVLLQLSEWLVVWYGGVPGHVEGLRMILGGPYWWVFLGWQVLLGTVVPLVLLALPTRKEPRAVSLAGLLIVLGFFGVRLNIVIPALAVEEVRGLAEAIASPRMDPLYFPSVHEWLVTLGVVGLGLLLFGVGERLLPKPAREVGRVRA